MILDHLLTQTCEVVDRAIVTDAHNNAIVDPDDENATIVAERCRLEQMPVGLESGREMLTDRDTRITWFRLLLRPGAAISATSVIRDVDGDGAVYEVMGEPLRGVLLGGTPIAIEARVRRIDA